jgi:hypothetical protein
MKVSFPTSFRAVTLYIAAFAGVIAVTAKVDMTGEDVVGSVGLLVMMTLSFKLSVRILL